ncbi:cation acetate symporter [Tessaracoccus sp. SD287]|uniref:solute symporter family protein n=1 Tax=Tessaracoccus sp. SD287 TaxID=2782008 RepID=UPI001A9757C9|nr:cation acetate symporter [Tessaracoccus sp. SD287]MBO1030198.1 cation acetate symporter [Tessaracoccus sp. SD287]
MITALESQYGNTAINIGVFALFVVATLGIVIWVSRRKTKATDFYTGGGSFSGRQNGVAITGDYLSAAAFLGVTGAIALSGYDGLLYSVGFFVALLVALYLVAERMRNTGKFTMADVLSFRMKQKPIRTAAATSTLVISFLYLLAQMAGAGGLVALLLGVSDKGMQSLVIALVGVLMVVYVLIGGMKGTTWVQMIKAVLLITGAAVMSFLVLKGEGFNLNSLLLAAQSAGLDPATGTGKDLLEPMVKYGATDWTKLSFISLSLALIAGPSGLPHVLMRFYTVPTAKEARRSAVWAIILVGVFFLLTLVLGMGAAKLVGQKAILAAPGGANAAAPLLALNLGGEVFMGIISGVAFATILAVVAGLTITASASFAHDVYNEILKGGKANPETEIKVARITSVVIGVLAILGGIAANGQNIAFLISLAFAVAASANLPSILFTLYWRRFNTRGSVWSIYTGLVGSVVLIVFSPAISGSRTSMLGADVDFAWFPLDNPALVSVPLAFLAGIVGTLTSKERGDLELAKEMEVRSMTGAGAGAAINH